ncbi:MULTISPECIES: hypothetical protein [Elizabethkingia]|uniref:hypothetical protein n=1 Tax=Elizabethkingia TaxID=308865 RepID=UPI000DD545BB|nr:MULTISPECIES: hypothetical protein [Elizabethkingia]MCT3803495.1 hypothetical protein [Elizabethkingia anophelis]MCT4127916.1 hypothetical protein [Elizabethkingia anophelis]MDV3844980.1 hypothetical protein [Elizabethkingia anophelis]MDX8555868.1 hypothetical protein [Elizabethkingia sp. HX CGY]RBA34785.1 hypothetical protein DSC50_08855 [Elizabethkingia anophelis]
MSLIDQHYKDYLDKVQLSEAEMPEDQKTETKRAFIAGMSTMFVTMLSGLPRGTTLNHYQREFEEYWTQETKNYDEQN